jgi:ribosomal protein S11
LIVVCQRLAFVTQNQTASIRCLKAEVGVVHICAAEETTFVVVSDVFSAVLPRKWSGEWYIAKRARHHTGILGFMPCLGS